MDLLPVIQHHFECTILLFVTSGRNVYHVLCIVLKLVIRLVSKFDCFCSEKLWYAS